MGFSYFAICTVIIGPLIRVQFKNEIPVHLDKLFNNYQKEALIGVLKDSSVYYYNLFLEAIKLNPQNFTDILNSNVRIS